jgi:putative transposase
MLMPLIKEHRGSLSVRQACQAVGLCPSTYHRWQRPTTPSKQRHSPRALTLPEREQVLAVLHEPRFVDRTPAHVVATLLDQKSYYCSERTMYRILAANQEAKERRAQAQRRRYAPPQLCAQGPNELWSWDISKLALVNGGHVSLYAIEDVYSRYVVGWMVAQRESASLACELVSETVKRQTIQPGQMTLHADRGSVMISDLLTSLLLRLGILQTHSRPRVSDDNPFSEALFKTLKYHPGYPGTFSDCEQARAWCATFFAWYNGEHKHSGLGYLSPAQVHLGQAAQHRAARAAVLVDAFARHPERFVKGVPAPSKLPEAVWINPPNPESSTAGSATKEVLQ